MILADQARLRRDLHPLHPADDTIVALRLLTSRRTDLIDERTRNLNRLHDYVTAIFPALDQTLNLRNRGPLINVQVMPIRCRRAMIPVPTPWTRVAVSHHQFGVMDSAIIDFDSADDSNGLILNMSHGAIINTGIHTGGVRVQCRAQPNAPDQVEPGPWEEIVEASVYSGTGNLGVESMEPSPEDDSYLQLPNLATAGPGWYRLRAHARGRDAPHAAVQNDPLEDYLLLCWPAPQAPTNLIHTTDRVGQTRRATATHRPTPPAESSAESAHEQLLRDNIRRRQTP